MKIRRNVNSIRASDGSRWSKLWGSSSSEVSPPGPVGSAGDQSKSKGKGKGKVKNKGTKNDAASADVMTKLLPDGLVSVGRTASCFFCQADTLSSSCCARTEVMLSTFAIPHRTFLFWLVVALWIAHLSLN